MKGAPLLNLVLAVMLTLAVGWLLVIGRPILAPIVAAVISLYLMTASTAAMRRAPVLRHLPAAVLRMIILLAFALVIYAFAVIIASTIADIAAAAPRYQANFEALAAELETRFGLDRDELLDDAIAVTFSGIDLRALTLTLLGGFTSVGSMAFLVVIYAAFLMLEQPRFPHKLAAALGGPEKAAEAARIVAQANARIGEYLTVKTAINVILAVISYVILWAMEVDFALFWAIVIGLLNYIPYVGSLIAVAFPVGLSLAQEGSLSYTLGLLALLTSAQVVMGNVVEPRVIGRQLNLSPVAVLAALSVWTAMWGLTGAILAVPLTAMLVIVLESFPSTRFLAVLLWDRVPTPEELAAAREAEARILTEMDAETGAEMGAETGPETGPETGEEMGARKGAERSGG